MNYNMTTYWHGSVANFDILEPRPTREFGDNKEYVFAIKSKLMAMVFMHRKISGYATWRNYGKQIVITEQYKGDLEKRYKNLKGYLYQIKDTEKCFHKHPKSTFTDEYICEKSITPIHKYQFDDVLNELKNSLKVIRYQDVHDFVIDLYKNNKIESIPKYRNKKMIPSSKSDGILFEGNNDEMYTTLEQAVLSFIYGPFVIPIFSGNNVMFFSYFPSKPKIDVKHNIKIKMYNNQNVNKLRQNIYYKNPRKKPIDTKIVTIKEIKNILDKIYYHKNIGKLIKKI
jgi:hypothetical protein